MKWRSYCVNDLNYSNVKYVMLDENIVELDWN